MKPGLNGSRRAAFVAFGAFSGINQSVYEALRRRLPGYELVWIDPGMSTRRGQLDALRQLAWAAAEFGPETGFDPVDWKIRRRWTTRVFERRSREARAQVSQGRYRFSVQMQSHYDASVPGLPHFVYSDNTLLANRHYTDTSALLGRPMRRPGELPVTPRWLELERNLYRNAVTTFTMSRNVHRSLIEDYGCREDQAAIALAGCNARIATDFQNNYGSANIVFVGVDWERKGGPQLVEAFRHVRTRFPNATLTVVGCTPSVTEPGVTIVGRIPFDEVWRYYTKASVFAMPTRYEPFGIVFLEAMAHRLPIVATNLAAIPDFVTHGENGFLIEPDDVESLATHLTSLIGNPDLCRTMGERGASVARRYTWDHTADIMASEIERRLLTPLHAP